MAKVVRFPKSQVSNRDNSRANLDQPYSLNMEYDYRFGVMRFIVEHSGKQIALFSAELGKMLRQVNISPHEIRALAGPEYAWTEGIDNIDKARVRLLEEIDFADRVVIDIGGYDGFAAEIAHKHGAARAICLDNHQYEHYGWKEIKKDGVEYVASDLMVYIPTSKDIMGPASFNMPQPRLPRPDIIINYNVLYHAKNPWAFLDRCRELINPNGEMLLCTLFRYHNGPWAYLYEPRECNKEDDTVYWGFSLAAIERLLKYTGWDAEQYALSYDRVLYRCKPTPNWHRVHEDT